MNVHAIIVKIGGKIFEDKENLNSTITQLKELLKRKIINNIVIIPGGGTLANFIRNADATLNMGDDLAHWSAILAMHYNGLRLSKNLPNVDYITDFIELQKLINDKKSKQILIFGSYNYLTNNDVLPHSWEVTSDSITLFLANRLKLDVCYLIKDIDGIINNENQIINELTATEFEKYRESDALAKIQKNENLSKESQPVDSYISKLINDYQIACIVLNGSKGKLNILHYFDPPENHEKVYTKISF
ncbi:MAG: hypothetical protein EU535_07205 [Promethearchaeota archaeon]|nr:MAG: hypothetical protein EU535_07205 [Candidatus Lokiarchaeota archaeon]